jgi:hypothetical protein
MLRMMAVCASLLLVSCIDGHEEFWLNADGSGHADIRYRLPAAAARLHGGESGIKQQIEQLLHSSPSISGVISDVTTEQDGVNVQVQFDFQSVTDLKQLAHGFRTKKWPSPAVHLAGDVHLSRSGRTVEFSRTVHASKALAGAMFLPASQFKGRKLRYCVHLPVAPDVTNAVARTDGGKTLTWEFPLSQAIRQPITTRFTAKIPIPAWVYGGAGVIAAIGVGAIHAYLRRRRSEVATASR